MADDSPPCPLGVLRLHFDYLVDSLCVDSVLPEARATELITIDEYDNCKAEPTNRKQAEKLVLCVERAVTANSKNFDLFLSILDRNGQKDIADRLCGRQIAGLVSTVEYDYVPDGIKIAKELTKLEKERSLLLTRFEMSVQEELCSCTKKQKEEFIGALQNDLDQSFTDFQSGFKYLKDDVTLFNIQYLWNTVEFLPEEKQATPVEHLNRFETELQQFLDSTTVKAFMEYCEKKFDKRTSDSMKAVIIMKLSDVWRIKTLANLKTLAIKKLKDKFKSIGSYLHLRSINEDCIAVHWLCPVRILPALRKAILSAVQSLQQDGVLQIFIGDEAVMVPVDVPELKLLVCGRTGVGKSSLCNSLIGRHVCKVGTPEAALGACTKTTTKTTVHLRGIVISIFESSGLQDGDIENEDTYVEDMYNKCSDADLVLYCVDMTVSRFMPAEMHAINVITKRFGPEIWNRCVFVLTKANLVNIPKTKKQTKIEYHENLFKKFEETICVLFKKPIPVRRYFDVIKDIHLVAAGNFDQSERDIYYASGYCKADPGPPIKRVDFIPELWVTCLETVPKTKQIRYLQATALDGRIKNPTGDLSARLKDAAEDLAKRIHDCADEAITYDRSPPTPFELNTSQEKRAKLTLFGTRIFGAPPYEIAIGGAVGGTLFRAAIGQRIGFKIMKHVDIDEDEEETELDHESKKETKKIHTCNIACSSYNYSHAARINHYSHAATCRSKINHYSHAARINHYSHTARINHYTAKINCVMTC